MVSANSSNLQSESVRKEDADKYSRAIRGLWHSALVVKILQHDHVCALCSVAKSCPVLCDPMDQSTPGFPVLHYLLEFAQTHVQWVSDAFQPSHPLSPSSSAFYPSVRIFPSESALRVRWSNYWSFFGIGPCQWVFRVDFFYDWLAWFLCSLSDSQESSEAPQFESINSLALSLPYGPPLTSV